MQRSTQVAGGAFISGLLADFEVLVDRVDGLHASLNEERGLRAESLESASKRMSDMDQNFTERSDELATSIAKWATGLSAQNLQVDDLATWMQSHADELGGRMTELENTCQVGGAVGELAGRLAACVVGPPSAASSVHTTVRHEQAQTDELVRRLAQLEENVALNQCHALAEVERLSSTLVNSSNNMAGRATAWSADNTADARGRLELLQQDVNKMASAAELSRVVAKLDGLQSNMDARMKFVTEEICSKASNSEFQSFRETISNYSFKVTLDQKLLKDIEAVLAPLPSNIQILNRRLDAETERTNACWVAVDKELGTRVRKSDLDMLASRMSNVEEAVPNASSPIASLSPVQASIEDLQGLTTRLEALEAGFGTRADGRALEKTRLAMSNQVARHEELQGTTESKFQALSSQMRSLVAKLEGKLSAQNQELVQQIQDELRKVNEEVRRKGGSEDTCTKDDLHQQLQQYYPKPEMDALLARVWWRLNQSGKVVGLSCLAGSPGFAAKAERPERPQSARR